MIGFGSQAPKEPFATPELPPNHRDPRLVRGRGFHVVARSDLRPFLSETLLGLRRGGGLVVLPDTFTFARAFVAVFGAAIAMTVVEATRRTR